MFWRLTEIDEKVEKVAKLVDEAQKYSNSFSLKLISIPKLNQNETAMESTKLCIEIFNATGILLIVSLPEIQLTNSQNQLFVNLFDDLREKLWLCDAKLRN